MLIILDTGAQSTYTENIYTSPLIENMNIWGLCFVFLWLLLGVMQVIDPNNFPALSNLYIKFGRLFNKSKEWRAFEIPKLVRRWGYVFIGTGVLMLLIITMN